MAFLAESTHELIPPNELESVIKHIIDNFVHDRCHEESITLGMNTIREMASRNKFILDEFNLNFLAQHYNYKNSNVARAAKAIINLYRTINPKLLDKKFYGRTTHL